MAAVFQNAAHFLIEQPAAAVGALNTIRTLTFGGTGRLD
jgi:hypothetical protein